MRRILLSLSLVVLAACGGGGGGTSSNGISQTFTSSASIGEMIDNGWCLLIENGHDKRFKFVIGTDLMESKLLEYRSMVLSLYKEYFDELHVQSVDPNKNDFTAQNT